MNNSNPCVFKTLRVSSSCASCAVYYVALIHMGSSHLCLMWDINFQSCRAKFNNVIGNIYHQLIKVWKHFLYKVQENFDASSKVTEYALVLNLISVLSHVNVFPVSKVHAVDIDNSQNNSWVQMYSFKLDVLY